MRSADHIITLVEGALAAERLLTDRGIERPAQLDQLLATLPDLEWSGVRQGQGFGPHGSGDDGHPYAACPVCGGLRERNIEFIASAVGHRSGCRLAAALGSPTVALPGQQEEMPL